MLSLRYRINLCA